MASSPLISVVTLIHTTDHKLPLIRKVLSYTTTPTQLIVVVNNPELSSHIVPQGSNELVVIAPRKGRGFAFLQGIEEVTGKITMLLHSDTIPPKGWDHAILKALKNPKTVGGGFSMTYDTPTPYLDFGTWIINQWIRFSGELYGDRAIFIRSHILKRCLSALEVPLFEDVQLAQCMRKYGRVVLLKEKVVTSARNYRKHGLVRYTGKFLVCRSWYALGGSPFHIYNAYYSITKS
jgi:cellulose synthase/poly-beta-1,6-N-acetylglucosamine synthase-like glycosyltransferase